MALFNLAVIKRGATWPYGEINNVAEARNTDTSRAFGGPAVMFGSNSRAGAVMRDG